MKYDVTLTLSYGDMLVLRHCVGYAMKFDKSKVNKQVLNELHAKISEALDK